MAHYAKVENGIVTQVIVAEQEFINSGYVGEPTDWVQTSYNTRGNLHYGQDGQPDGGIALRGNYAGIGYTYDATNDVFYAPQPYPSWILNNTTWIWEAPSPMPTDGKIYKWDEPTLGWIEIIQE
jgi:hypothetical protein